MTYGKFQSKFPTRAGSEQLLGQVFEQVPEQVVVQVPKQFPEVSGRLKSLEHSGAGSNSTFHGKFLSRFQGKALSRFSSEPGAGFGAGCAEDVLEIGAASHKFWSALEI